MFYEHNDISDEPFNTISKLSKSRSTGTDIALQLYSD